MVAESGSSVLEVNKMLGPGKHLFLLHTEKLGMARAACDSLIKLAAGGSTTIFFERLNALVKLSDTWANEDESARVELLSHGIPRSVEKSSHRTISRMSRKLLRFKKGKRKNINRSIVSSADIDNPPEEDIKPFIPLTADDDDNILHRYDDNNDNEDNDEDMILSEILREIKSEPGEGELGETADGKRTYCCEHCGEMLASVRALSIHNERHVGPASKPCEYCGKMFTRREGMRRHLASVHNKDKKIVCNECGKGFTRNDHLRLHMRCHTGERPYLCNDCGKCFQTGPHLKKHQLSHSGYKPFVCKICERGFVNVESLRKHSLRHT